MQAARRVLTARYRVGMFQPPDSVPFASIGAEVVGSAEHKAAAVEAVEKGAFLHIPDIFLRNTIVRPHCLTHGCSWAAEA